MFSIEMPLSDFSRLQDRIAVYFVVIAPGSHRRLSISSFIKAVMFDSDLEVSLKF